MVRQKPDKPIAWDQVAIVTVTRRGAEQGRRLLAATPGASLYVPARFAAAAEASMVCAYREPIGSLLARLFAAGRFLIAFAATGVVVRVLAPLLRGKQEDPGVLVVDDEARHVISLLGGHRGGANVMAQAVAAVLGAAPVLTTASESLGLPALDLLGQEFGWRLEEEEGLPAAMAALVNGEPLLICQEAGEPAWRQEPLPAHVTLVTSLAAVQPGSYAAAVLISDRALPAILEGWPGSPRPPLVLYRPRTLALGIGCERGVTAEEIEDAVHACLARNGLAFGSLRVVASLAHKRDETGLLTFAERHALPLRWYHAHELRAGGGPTPSSLVERHVGTPGVAEPAALLASGRGTLVVPKYRQGRVTVAVARGTHWPRSPGRILLVGLGPGDRADLTPRALAALAQADTVLGYRRYLDQIRDLLTGKAVIPGELTKERERAGETVRLAMAGRTVALVSSGDIGIYGMAGLVFEVLAAQGWAPASGVEVVVVPGITALSACAALLGAPVMHDFAAISLSDRLTPWPQIVRRLEAVAQSDFVIALYNPKSASRTQPFHEACRILLEHRPPATPVGVVTRAGRPGCRTLVTTLANLPTCEVDMETTILIGSCATRVLGDRLVTSRGYPAAARRCEELRDQTSEQVGEGARVAEGDR
ncbi:precorrin-3B C(17)-methyltransferase [Nitrospira sp. Kam-Ns4a]